MKQIFLLSILFTFLKRCDATRCFECQNIPYPEACAQLAVCSLNEYCFTEQYVTTSGSISYNTGCMYYKRCNVIRDQFIGKLSSNVTRRSSVDISTCTECCHGDFCNNQGCGTKAAPVEQRGPYCFQCDALLDPKACTNVAVCLQNEICLLHSPKEFAGLPETIYKSGCGKQSACNTVSQASMNAKCVPTCCNTDFCNEYCMTPTHASMTSSYPITTDDKIQTTEANTTLHPTELSTVTSLHWQNVSTTHVRKTETSSKRPSHISTTPGISQSSTTHGHSFHCHAKDGFAHLQNSHAQLCVHIVLHHTPLSWDDARAECKKHGADLVVLDTHDKALLMRKELASHSRYQSHDLFWIGAKDFSNHDHFSWVNGHDWNNTAADWSRSQPDHLKNGHDQDCVCMFKDPKQMFTWHDKSCNQEGSYICERK
ncbi:uncharacterized protein LOC123532580 [Mercenaria mercenaria]|uniref:uncharacterized protein LOC123532580 n=1 Tax=Mercenaria mercenaria TaxID=6596 RepID=UPI00234F936D|nr:uncharacterized protein LOC123532580 [Mercenaria mercenaria]